MSRESEAREVLAGLCAPGDAERIRRGGNSAINSDRAIAAMLEFAAPSTSVQSAASTFNETGDSLKVAGEILFRAFMAGDVARLTTTALLDDWSHMQPSFQDAWCDLAAAIRAMTLDITKGEDR